MQFFHGFLWVMAFGLCLVMSKWANQMGGKHYPGVLTSLKLTYPLKIDPWKRRFLLETISFRGYVSFRECSASYLTVFLHRTLFGRRSWKWNSDASGQGTLEGFLGLEKGRGRGRRWRCGRRWIYGICICTHAYVYIYTNAYTYICCVYIYTHLWMHVSSCICMHAVAYGYNSNTVYWYGTW